MSDERHPDDPESRLAALGRRPIDADVRAEHLRRATAAPPSAPRRRFGPVAIGAAAIVGFLAGSAGLASAGALPDPAQNFAHDVLDAVRVDVPEGSNRHGACISEAAKIDDKDAKQAAKEACPPGGADDAPGKSGDAPGKSGDAPGQVKHADDPCRGRPAWAGPMSKDERASLKESQSRDGCDDTDQPDPEEPDTEEQPAP